MKKKSTKKYWVLTLLSEGGYSHFLKFLEHLKETSALPRRLQAAVETNHPLLHDSGFLASHRLEHSGRGGHKVRTERGA